MPLFCTPPIVIVIVVQRLAEAPGQIDQQCGNPLHIRIVQRAHETNRSESPLRLTIFIIGCNKRIAGAPHQGDGIRIEDARGQQRAKLFGGDERTDLLHQFGKLRDDGDQPRHIVAVTVQHIDQGQQAFTGAGCACRDILKQRAHILNNGFTAADHSIDRFDKIRQQFGMLQQALKRRHCRRIAEECQQRLELRRCAQRSKAVGQFQQARQIVQQSRQCSRVYFWRRRQRLTHFGDR